MVDQKLDIRVDVQGGRVVTMFSQSVQNFSLTPRDAAQFGAFLITKAKEATGGKIVMPAKGPGDLILPPGMTRK